ncbi:MAG: phosphate acyltransferase PlsX [Ruminococcus sp.]|nr:phosphate acyltransferase PlsX [Ruminococcus sp.]
MNIVMDAFGGDNAPLEVIKGAIDAHNDFKVDITLVGDEEKIKTCAKDNGLDISGLKLRQADDVIDICDDPKSLMKSKKNSSMAVGMRMLADGEGDAFVSAGSTGALLVGGTFIVKRIKGLKRPALATLLPTTDKPCMLLDSGANAECRPDILVQFGLMGSIYMNKVMKMENPKVALANIGAEASKGRPIELETYPLMQQAPFNFTGNIEARHIPFDEADVVVADGFCGNLILKTYEGMGKFFAKSIKDMFYKNAKTKIAAAMMMGDLKAFKKSLDYSEYGGAPLLGTRKAVIKAHGSSNARAFYNAVRQAKEFIASNAINEISEVLTKMKSADNEADD